MIIGPDFTYRGRNRIVLLEVTQFIDYYWTAIIFMV